MQAGFPSLLRIHHMKTSTKSTAPTAQGYRDKRRLCRKHLEQGLPCLSGAGDGTELSARHRPSGGPPGHSSSNTGAPLLPRHPGHYTRKVREKSTWATRSHSPQCTQAELGARSWDSSCLWSWSNVEALLFTFPPHRTVSAPDSFKEQVRATVLT